MELLHRRIDHRLDRQADTLEADGSIPSTTTIRHIANWLKHQADTLDEGGSIPPMPTTDFILSCSITVNYSKLIPWRRGFNSLHDDKRPDSVVVKHITLTK